MTTPRVAMRLTSFGLGHFICPNTFQTIKGWGFCDVRTCTQDGLWQRSNNVMATGDPAVYTALNQGASVPMTLHWYRTEGDSLTSWFKNLDEECQERGITWYPDTIELMNREAGSPRRSQIRLGVLVDDADAALLLKLAWR